MGATVCRYALSIFIIPVSIQFVKGQTGFLRVFSREKAQKPVRFCAGSLHNL